jgi:hypothetical protein
MGLNEILEENTIKSISQKTRISEENIQDLFAENFKKINQTKALGFISIIEREYKANLSDLKTKAIAYYQEEVTEKDFVIAMPSKEASKKKSKWFFVIVFLIFVIASWYFLSQYGEKHEGPLLAFIHTEEINETNVNSEMKEEAKKPIEDLSIAKVIASGQEKNQTIAAIDEKGHVAIVTENSIKDIEGNETLDENSSTQIPQTEMTEKVTPQISLVPVKKIWFGLVNLETKAQQSLTMDQPYMFDVKKNSWLVATSAASFSMVDGEKTEKFTGKRCYFKIDKSGVQVLDKDQFVNAGGSKKW